MNNQYVYKLKKMSKSALSEFDKKYYEDINSDEYIIIDKDDVNNCPKMYEDLNKIISSITLISSALNIDKIRKFYDIPRDYTLVHCKINNGKIGCIFSDVDKIKKITLLIGNPKMFFQEEEKEYFICKCNQKYTLENRSDIVEIIKRTYNGNVDDKGFYWISSDMIKKINRVLSPKISTNTSNLFFHSY